MKQILRAILLLGGCWAGSAPALANEPQAASFASLDGTPLSAWVLMPDKPPRGTVVALHGCGGLFSASSDRKDRLSARHQAMAELLVAQGYAVVFPDSFTPRGVSELCTQHMKERGISQTERRSDALAALQWAADQPWAQPNKIALLGWSHGGSAVLASTDAGNRQVAAQAVRPSLALAFYPGCSAALKNGYRPTTRLVLMLGALDDWTAPEPCVTLGQAAGAEVNLYPESYHDFDNPVGTVKLRRDVPNGIHPGQGVHAGRNPAARAQAYARLCEVLQAAFERE